MTLHGQTAGGFSRTQLPIISEFSIRKTSEEPGEELPQWKDCLNRYCTAPTPDTFSHSKKNSESVRFEKSSWTDSDFCFIKYSKAAEAAHFSVVEHLSYTLYPDKNYHHVSANIIYVRKTDIKAYCAHDKYDPEEFALLPHTWVDHRKNKQEIVLNTVIISTLSELFISFNL